MAERLAPVNGGYDLSTIDLTMARQAVDEVLDGFVAAQVRAAEATELRHPVAVLRDYLAGGKRLRPLLCCCGWYAAGGPGTDLAIARVAAALELFHTFALIHDDIIDAADSRRGRPTVHRSLATWHAARGDTPHPDRIGTGGAVLLGDLAFVWSDQLLHASGIGPHQLAAVRPLLDTMRDELLFGQYLDMVCTGIPSVDLERTLLIALYKSGKYTIERPLQIGARLAGGDDATLAACSAFGLPVGEAFQLRDDVLGVFGDPEVTGKSRLDDLRDGKPTALLAIALARAGADRVRLVELVGDPDLDEEGAAAARRIIVASGALAAVEEMISERLARGLAALDAAPFAPTAVEALRAMAHAAVVRSA